MMRLFHCVFRLLAIDVLSLWLGIRLWHRKSTRQWKESWLEILDYELSKHIVLITISVSLSYV